MHRRMSIFKSTFICEPLSIKNTFLKNDTSEWQFCFKYGRFKHCAVVDFFILKNIYISSITKYIHVVFLQSTASSFTSHTKWLNQEFWHYNCCLTIELKNSNLNLFCSYEHKNFKKCTAILQCLASLRTYIAISTKQPWENRIQIVNMFTYVQNDIWCKQWERKKIHICTALWVLPTVRFPFWKVNLQSY